jgi:diaminopimelate epimerase
MLTNKNIVNFTKMHGLGNDFVVFNCTEKPLNLTKKQLQFIANRNFGIGCDQILFVENSNKNGIDFRYRIFNADGGEVEQCGNGARCFAKFIRDNKLSDKNELIVETNTGNIILYIDLNEQITVNMGIPHFNPIKIPFKTNEIKLKYKLTIDKQEISIGVVSMGNPHAVLLVEDVTTADVQNLGKKIEQHKNFPQRVNVGFMEIIDKNNIKLRVFERGTGETLACGTGACAAVVIGQRWGLLNNNVKVELPGGFLTINTKEHIYLTGAATTVFEGNITL